MVIGWWLCVACSHNVRDMMVSFNACVIIFVYFGYASMHTHTCSFPFRWDFIGWRWTFVYCVRFFLFIPLYRFPSIPTVYCQFLVWNHNNNFQITNLSILLSLSMSRARSLVGFAFKINRYSSIWSFETKQITKHWDLCLYARGFCVFALGVFLSWNNNIQFIKAHIYASLDWEHSRKLAIFGSSTIC